MTDILMPEQGQSVKSCLILEWLVKEGDVIEEGHVVCEVETDKATFEVESPIGGVVRRILFAENTDVPVLTPIAQVEEKVT